MRGVGEGVKRGDDGDDDNGERLLTKIEVVVMTGIARDEALRGDALADALASFEKKIERERIRERVIGRERERKRGRGEPTRVENEGRDTRKRIGERAKDNNSGTGWLCRLYHNIGIAAVLKIMIISRKSGLRLLYKLM